MCSSTYSPLFMRIAYGGNIIAAGVMGAMLVFAPSFGANRLFDASASLGTNIAGSLFLAIAVFSVFGLIWPYRFSPILVLQLFAKVLFLLSGVLPLLVQHKLNKVGPITLAVMNVIWAIILPFFVPWKHIFDRDRED